MEGEGHEGWIRTGLHMTLNFLRAVMCGYQQQMLLWGSDGRKEGEDEAGHERDSLIYPRKAQRNWRRTRRTKLDQRRKAKSTGLFHLYFFK